MWRTKEGRRWGLSLVILALTVMASIALAPGRAPSAAAVWAAAVVVALGTLATAGVWMASATPRRSGFVFTVALLSSMALASPLLGAEAWANSARSMLWMLPWLVMVSGSSLGRPRACASGTTPAA